VTASRYRCRLHPDYVVTWKGTGCVACAEDARRKAWDAQIRDRAERTASTGREW